MDLIETYLAEMEQVIRQISVADVRAVVDVLENAWLAGSTVFLIGNGGSAATASHMMNDWNKMTRVDGMARLRAIALTDCVPLMTAIANDQHYVDVFVEPLANLLRPRDVLVAISGSGNSPNIIKAVEYARAHDAIVVGLCGRPGGRLAQLAEVKVITPSDRIGQQEDGHMIMNHIISAALLERIRRRRAV